MTSNDIQKSYSLLGCFESFLHTICLTSDLFLLVIRSSAPSVSFGREAPVRLCLCVGPRARGERGRWCVAHRLLLPTSAGSHRRPTSPHVVPCGQRKRRRASQRGDMCNSRCAVFKFVHLVTDYMLFDYTLLLLFECKFCV